jgi:hypothetical protein
MAMVTEIVFLRKRPPGEPSRPADPEWLHVTPLAIDGAEVPINQYFLHHPDMVLGRFSRKDTLYGLCRSLHKPYYAPLRIMRILFDVTSVSSGIRLIPLRRRLLLSA